MFLSFCVLDDLFCFSKNSDFGVFLVQQNMVETTLPDGLETFGQKAYQKFWYISRRFWVFCVLDDFFRFSKKSGFGVFLVQPTMVLVLLSASVERCFVSRMQDFFCKSLHVWELFWASLLVWVFFCDFCPLRNYLHGHGQFAGWLVSRGK